MQTVEELWQAYQDWKRLTEEEAAAIQGRQWPAVHETQQRKRSLQTEIIRLTDKAKADLHTPSETRNFDQRLRQIVNELILLETQNNGKIEACIASAQAERQGLDVTSTRLRKVHNCYVPAPESLWENVS